MLKVAAALAFAVAASPIIVVAQASTDSVAVSGAIALAVEDRVAIDTGTEFPADVGQLFGWTSITGAAGTTIQHVWRHQSHEFTVDIEIGGSPWRVWTSKTIPPEWTGQWTFEVLDETGEVVFSTDFTVGSD